MYINSQKWIVCLRFKLHPGQGILQAKGYALGLALPFGSPESTFEYKLLRPRTSSLSTRFFPGSGSLSCLVLLSGCVYGRHLVLLSFFAGLELHTPPRASWDLCPFDGLASGSKVLKKS